MRHVLSAGGVPPAAEAAWDHAAVITSEAHRDGWETGYTHQAVTKRTPHGPPPIESSKFQTITVEHGGFQARRSPWPIFYPRNLGLTFKVERQIDRSTNPYADQPQQQTIPQWRRALQYPRAVITPPTYPIVQG